MIVELNHKDADTAQKMLDVQLPSYLVEAELIGFHDIPPLRDTTATIRESGESFIGFTVDQELAGFVSYELADDGNCVDICRMVVHPDYFRRGIARQLLSHLLAGAAAHKKVTVSTGERNEPAKSLYRSFGFTEAKQIEIAPGVKLSLFELPAVRG
ncbi:GNAT family N-acetyltransferase [Paenibacillus nanensis]|uniref:GNAT family N-acetyltransferase n=1 Tax=Paenibacillus nanensis TaxID=393251 RepID=A0A3A1UMJ3_9BACL|nr:GNAT family N-acetyltransferase [Paenibacillus nanensis]RIX48620.1 GNAT family N-acetyltransferase [Paenibacillus nanensis]